MVVLSPNLAGAMTNLRVLALAAVQARQGSKLFLNNRRPQSRL